MAPSAGEVGRKLDSIRDALAEEIVERHYKLHPELDLRYGKHGRQKCREDAAYHLRYLVESLVNASPTVFREYVSWAKVMLTNRGVPARDLADNLGVIVDVLKARLPVAEATIACHYVEPVISEISEMTTVVPCCIVADQPLAQLAKEYLNALLETNRQKASRMIMDAVENGTSIKDIYIHVFQQSQWEIGRLWQTNQITVAHEHFCTAATQLIMSQLYPRIFSSSKIGRRFVGACVSGDLHEIGIRMVADFLEMAGWDTVYLGASVPGADLIRTLQQHKPDVLGISVTITLHVGAVARIIADTRAAPECNDVKILVGGHPFHADLELWKRVGADGTAVDAQSSLDLANQLVLN